MMFNSTFLVALAAFVALIYALVWVIHESKKNKKQLTDYYALFLMGGAWILIGLLMRNYGLTITGVVFVIIGLTNKSEWHKDHEQWKKLKGEDKKDLIALIILLAVIFSIGIAAFFLLRNLG